MEILKGTIMEGSAIIAQEDDKKIVFRTQKKDIFD
jgi:hypothetical protein